MLHVYLLYFYIYFHVFSPFVSIDVFLGLPVALLKATVAAFALYRACSRAGPAFLPSWLSGGPDLLEAVGLQGFPALCGCFGLCLVFACVGCGVAVGYGAMAALRGKRTALVNGCCGIGVFLGCGLAGVLLGWALHTLTALGARGLCLLGFLLCLSLLHLHQEVKALDPAGLLCLSATIYIVVHLGVCSILAMDMLEPKISLVHVFLVLVSFLMVFLADQLVFQTTRGHLTLNILLLIPLAGILLGLDVKAYQQDPLQFFHTGSSAPALCSRLVMLTGTTGVLLGGLALTACEAEREGSVSLWISCPTAALLHLLDETTRWRLAAVVEFGLWLGLTAASGISLGLAAVSVLKRSFQCVMLALGTPLDVGRADATTEHRLSVLMDVTVKLAVLGVVLLGASLLGAAALLTASLGSAGLLGVGGASLLTLLEGIYRVYRKGTFT